MKLKLAFTNTLTRQKEPFKPIDPKNVRLYVCGITPYDDTHIGHARVMVVFDVLYRMLNHFYGEDAVTYVRNFTDIDDKIIARANELKQEPAALTQKFIKSFHEEMAALNNLAPTHEPKVSDTKVMKGIISFIEKLVKKGDAYTIKDDGVYLDLTKIEESDEYHYGQLSGKKLSELIAGARVEINTGKRNAGDFALWKFAKAGEPSWDAPWGKGRPGWHIECSVMSEQLLGSRFDLHGGGEDLQFPHHENELAQSVACHGHIHANTWLHNSFITVGGTKMSKSLGNFTTIKDALNKFSGEAIRMWLLQTHYRKPVDYSETALQAAQTSLEKLYKTWNAAFKKDPKPAVTAWKGTCSRLNPFRRALMDDLNTAAALAEVHTAANFLAESLRNQDENKIRYWRQRLGYMANMLGILQHPEQFTADTSALNSTQQKLFNARTAARKAKDWKESDRLRDELKKQGILVEDKSDGTTTFRRA